MLIELNVVVDVHSGFLPNCELVWQSRQGSESRLVQRLEQLPAGLAQVLHSPVIDLRKKIVDSVVQVVQTEEFPVSQPGKNPALYHLHTNFHLSLVLGPSHPGRDHSGSVVLRQIVVGGIDVGFITARVLDASLEVVWNQYLGHTTEEGESSHVTTGPIGKILAPLCFGIGVVAGAKSCHKDLRLSDLSGLRIDHGDCLARVIYEKLLPGFVGLAHRRIQALGPPAVEFTKLAVFVTVGVGFSIFEPQQAQGHTLASKLCVDLVPVGKRNNSRRRTGTFGEEEPKEIVLTKAFRKWPGKSGRFGTANILDDGTVGDRAAAGYGSDAETTLPLQAKDFLDIAHGQPFLGHHHLLGFDEAEDARTNEDYPASLTCPKLACS